MARFYNYIMFKKFMKIMEIKMIMPISNKSQLIANIRRYNDVVAKCANQMPFNRAWYGIRHKGRILLAPSKFIGYQDLTPETYGQLARKGLDGRVTEAIIRRWAEPVEQGHPDFDDLHVALNELCARFGKKPNAIARVSIVRSDNELPEPLLGDELIALLAAVYEGLNPAQKRAFHSRIDS